LILTAVLIGSGLAAAGVGARFALRKKAPAPETEEAPKAAPSPLRAAGFSVDLGDVISIDGRELWLERGWVLSEAGEPVAAVLFADAEVIIALPPPEPRLSLLKETELSLPEDPPASLEAAGARFERVRRLPVEAAALANTPPPPWASALLCEYRGLGGEQLWVVGHGAFCRAFVGRAVNADEFEMWGKG
jgi:hypothetical protein